VAFKLLQSREQLVALLQLAITCELLLYASWKFHASSPSNLENVLQVQNFMLKEAHAT